MSLTMLGMLVKKRGPSRGLVDASGHARHDCQSLNQTCLATIPYKQRHHTMKRTQPQPSRVSQRCKSMSMYTRGSKVCVQSIHARCLSPLCTNNIHIGAFIPRPIFANLSALRLTHVSKYRVNRCCDQCGLHKHILGEVRPCPC